MVDLHMLDDFDDWEDDEEVVIEQYVDELMDEFIESPEGKELLEMVDSVGFMIHSFIDYGYMYEGYTLPTMSAGNAEFVLEVLLPRKISLSEPAHADEGLLELIAFWTFLDRVYRPPKAKSILNYLRSVSPEHFRRIMFDPSRAGMAKSFFMGGQQAGFDMSDQEEMDAFMHLYNQQILTDEPDESELNYLAPARPKPLTAEQSQQKKRRKMAKASRRKNRKSKKKKRK